jgi:hypothetical protein
MTSPGYFKRLTRLKKLFWLYFLLLIFEGALRKWIVPQLSAPLLIIRDPVSIWIIWEAYRSHKWPIRWSALISGLTLFLVGLFFAQIIFGDTPLTVGLFGLRSYLLPFPVIFIMAENLDEEDLRKLAACTLWLLLPETLLELAQYRMPGSVLNIGAYEGARQIGFIGEHVRSSGTFSSAIGAESFATLAAAFIIFGITSPGFAKKWMLWIGAFAVMLSVPTMGSRTVVFQVASMFVCLAIAASMRISQAAKVLRIILPVVFLSLLAAQLPIFSDAMQNLTKRFTSANAAEGGEAGARGAILYRTIGPLLDEVERVVSSGDWMGVGMGYNANVFNQSVRGGADSPDNEILREMSEFGFAGIGFGLFKLFLAMTLLSRALAQVRDGQLLALLMLPLAVSALLLGTPEQPTVQGFIVIITAVCISAARAPAPTEAEVLQLALLRQQLLQRRVRERGRLGAANTAGSEN